MFNCLTCHRLVLISVLAVFSASEGIPYPSYEISWKWDDSTGSGIGDAEEAITTIKGKENSMDYEPNSLSHTSHESPLPLSERVS